MSTFKLKRYEEEVIDDEHIRLHWIYTIDNSGYLEMINTFNITEVNLSIVNGFIKALYNLYKENEFDVIFRNMKYYYRNGFINAHKMY